MTEPPDYVTAIPNSQSIHVMPTLPGEVGGLGITQEQLIQFGEDLIEGIIRAVVLKVVGVLLPGPAGEQLTSWATGIFDKFLNLGDIFGGLDLGDGSLDIDDVWTTVIEDIINPLNLLASITNVVDIIFEAITGLTRGGTDPIEDLNDILTHIPFLNILGVGGPSDIGGSITSGWDQLISGFVGVIGSGTGLADLFNVGQQVSSNAALGGFSWDILGIRNNRALTGGFHPTSQSNISLDKLSLGVSALPTFAVTQSTAITGYHRMSEASDNALVSWQGYGVTSVTHCFVNVYQMDLTTGDNTLVHASANIIGDLTGGSVAVPVVYEPSPAIHVEPGEVYGIEIAIRGAGTHNIAGAQSGLQDQPVYPRRWSSVRNSGTSAAPSSFTPSYGTNVPFIEFGVSAGDVSIPHSAEIRQFSTAGSTSYPIPSWANFVDRVVLGGAGGGHQGGTWGIGGAGGDNATWNSDTLERGVDFSGAASLTTAVAAGGTGGTGNGANGSTSTSSISGGPTLSSSGGAGATSFDVLGSQHAGESPGNYTFPGGGPAWVVVGGAQQNTYGANGPSPGSGGAGGNWVSFQPGGDGAPGTILYRFRQS